MLSLVDDRGVIATLILAHRGVRLPGGGDLNVAYLIAVGFIEVDVNPRGGRQGARISPHG